MEKNVKNLTDKELMQEYVYNEKMIRHYMGVKKEIKKEMEDRYEKGEKNV